jgi:hypothetical protein
VGEWSCDRKEGNRQKEAGSFEVRRGLAGFFTYHGF